jgi:putative hemolysin
MDLAFGAALHNNFKFSTIKGVAMSQTIWRIIRWVFILCITAVLTGCTPTTTPPPAPVTESSSQIANPASENCVKQGGTLSIQKRGDGGEYGVCAFEDNRQCEEWALMRGECPSGGVKITGYVTSAAQYCAITGGEYTVTGSSNTEQEQGTCTFKNGKACDAADYFAGTCDPNSEVKSYNDPFLYCMAVGTIDTPDESYTGEKVPQILVQDMIDLGLVTADAPKEIQQNAVWRCMDSSLWVCHFGANLPCTEKADSSQTPTSAMEDYCKANPSAESIPAATTGRATVYEWKCTGGKPEVGQQILHSDPQGFLSEFWHQLAAG